MAENPNNDQNEQQNEAEALEKFWQDYYAEKNQPTPENVEKRLSDAEKKEISTFVTDKIVRKKEIEVLPAQSTDDEMEDLFGDLGESEEEEDEILDEALIQKVPEIPEIIKRIKDLPDGTDLVEILRVYKKIKTDDKEVEDGLIEIQKKYGQDIKEFIKSLEITNLYLQKDLIQDSIEREDLEEEVSKFVQIGEDEDFRREEDFVKKFDDILHGKYSEEDKDEYLEDELKFAGYITNENGEKEMTEPKFNYTNSSLEQREAFKKKIEAMQQKTVEELVPEEDQQLLNRLYQDAIKAHQAQIAELEDQLAQARVEQQPGKISGLEKDLRKIKEDVFDITVKALDTKKLSSGFLKLYLARLKYFIEIREKINEKNSEIFEKYYKKE